MFQFRSNKAIQTKRKFKMDFGDRFMRWYQRYFTEITWFLIGNITVQLVNALEKHNYLEATWCAVIAVINYWIWKRNQ